MLNIDLCSFLYTVISTYIIIIIIIIIIKLISLLIYFNYCLYKSIKITVLIHI